MWLWRSGREATYIVPHLLKENTAQITRVAEDEYKGWNKCTENPFSVTTFQKKRAVWKDKKSTSDSHYSCRGATCILEATEVSVREARMALEMLDVLSSSKSNLKSVRKCEI